MKKSPEKKEKNQDEWQHKQKEIQNIAYLISNVITKKDDIIFVPAATSKDKNDKLYDDRLVCVLEAVKKIIGVDYVELIETKQSTIPAHRTNKLRTPEEAMKNIELKVDKLEFIKNKLIILFDDVFTSGSTFKATQRLIQKYSPETKVFGLFVAKTKQFF